MLGLLGAAIAAGTVLARSARLNGAVLQSPRRLSSVFLRSAAGPVRLSDYEGRLVLMYFGYMSCPDVCPTTLAKLREAIGQLTPEQAAQVQVMFVSVDPDRDDVEGLEKYAHVFGEDFIGATGTRGEIDLVAGSLGVYYKINEPEADGSYTVHHSSQVYVIDREGNLVMLWGHDIQPDEIRDDLRRIIERGIPGSERMLAGPTPSPVVCSLTLVPAHVATGQWLYEHHCAQCHGTDLRGNPAWKTELADGSRLPPPLDHTGDAWSYSETEFAELVETGRNLDKPIHMPAFAESLTDWEIHHIHQYIASTWNVDQKNYQAGLLTLTPQPTWGPLPPATATPAP